MAFGMQGLTQAGQGMADVQKSIDATTQPAAQFGDLTPGEIAMKIQESQPEGPTAYDMFAGRNVDPSPVGIAPQAPPDPYAGTQAQQMPQVYHQTPPPQQDYASQRALQLEQQMFQMQQQSTRELEQLRERARHADMFEAWINSNDDVRARLTGQPAPQQSLMSPVDESQLTIEQRAILGMARRQDEIERMMRQRTSQAENAAREAQEVARRSVEAMQLASEWPGLDVQRLAKYAVDNNLPGGLSQALSLLVGNDVMARMKMQKQQSGVFNPQQQGVPQQYSQQAPQQNYAPPQGYAQNPPQYQQQMMQAPPPQQHYFNQQVPQQQAPPQAMGL